MAMAYCGRQPIEAERAAPKIAGATRSRRRRQRRANVAARTAAGGRRLDERRLRPQRPSRVPAASATARKRSAGGSDIGVVEWTIIAGDSAKRSAPAIPTHDVAADAVEGVGEDQVDAGSRRRSRAMTSARKGSPTSRLTALPRPIRSG